MSKKEKKRHLMGSKVIRALGSHDEGWWFESSKKITWTQNWIPSSSRAWGGSNMWQAWRCWLHHSVVCQQAKENINIMSLYGRPRLVLTLPPNCQISLCRCMRLSVLMCLFHQSTFSYTEKNFEQLVSFLSQTVSIWYSSHSESYFCTE